jgi:hypothetical protein
MTWEVIVKNFDYQKFYKYIENQRNVAEKHVQKFSSIHLVQDSSYWEGRRDFAEAILLALQNEAFD